MPQIDLDTAKAELAKARDLVTFYRSIVDTLSHPLFAGATLNIPEGERRTAPAAMPETEDSEESSQKFLAPDPSANLSPGKRSKRGEVRGKVFEALPDYGTTPGISTTALQRKIEDGGYVFLAKTPTIAINDALVELAADDKAEIVDRKGLTNYWTKGVKA